MVGKKKRRMARRALPAARPTLSQELRSAKEEYLRARRAVLNAITDLETSAHLYAFSQIDDAETVIERQRAFEHQAYVLEQAVEAYHRARRGYYALAPN